MAMFAWVLSDEERRAGGDGPETIIRCATSQGPEPVRLDLDLVADPSSPAPPDLTVRSAPVGCRIESLTGDGTRFRSRLIVEPPADPEADDQVIVDLADADGRGVPPCRVVLRRSTLPLRLALLGSAGSASDLDPQ